MDGRGDTFPQTCYYQWAPYLDLPQARGAVSTVFCPIEEHFFADKNELEQINVTAHTVYVR